MSPAIYLHCLKVRILVGSDFGAIHAGLLAFWVSKQSWVFPWRKVPCKTVQPDFAILGLMKTGKRVAESCKCPASSFRNPLLHMLIGLIVGMHVVIPDGWELPVCKRMNALLAVAELCNWNTLWGYRDYFSAVIPVSLLYRWVTTFTHLWQDIAFQVNIYPAFFTSAIRGSFLSYYPSSSMAIIVLCKAHHFTRYGIYLSKFPPPLALLCPAHQVCQVHQVDRVTRQEEFACANTQVKLALFSVPMEMPDQSEGECVAPVNKIERPRFLWWH